MFSSCAVAPDSKETELGSSNQEASPSAGKNTGVVLVQCRAWSMSLQLFLMMRLFLRPLVSFLMTDGFSVSVTKITSRIGFHELAAYLSTFNLFQPN